MSPTTPPYVVIISFLVFLPLATPFTVFNFTSFTPNTPNITFSGDSFTSGDNIIQLTRNQADDNLRESSGRAVYANPIKLYDPTTRVVQDFVTHFEFIVKAVEGKPFGDGLAFFIAPVGSVLPYNSSGQWLGLFNATNDNLTSNSLVAVEFDTFKNAWDPDENHIGIDVNSIMSVKTITWDSNFKDGRRGAAWIGYNATLKNLFVYLSYDQEPYAGVPSLSYDLDLTTVLPDKVIVGFSASTGSSTELHKILSWNFVSYGTISPPIKPNGIRRLPLNA